MKLGYKYERSGYDVNCGAGDAPANIADRRWNERYVRPGG